MFSVDVEGTRIVLEEALRAGGGARRLHLLGGGDRSGPRRARTPTRPRRWEAGRYAIPYLDAKHEAETVALRLIARGLPLVIVNPAHVLGAGDPGRSSTALVRRFLRRQIPAYVDGTLNIVGVQDVARGHLLADERGRVGERYILGNRNFTMTRLFADLGRLSGVEPPALKLPADRGAGAGRPPGSGLGPTDLPTPDRGPRRLAELGFVQPQGQARAGLEHLAARGLPGGDDRVVPRAATATAGRGRRPRSRWPLRAGRWAPARRC